MSNLMKNIDGQNYVELRNPATGTAQGIDLSLFPTAQQINGKWMVPYNDYQAASKQFWDANYAGGGGIGGWLNDALVNAPVAAGIAGLGLGAADIFSGLGGASAGTTGGATTGATTAGDAAALAEYGAELDAAYGGLSTDAILGGTGSAGTGTAAATDFGLGGTGAGTGLGGQSYGTGLVNTGGASTGIVDTGLGGGAGLGGGTTGYGLAGNAAIPATTAATTAASNVFKIPGTDITIPGNVIAGGLQGILGYLGAQQQAGALGDVANQYLAIGAPYRGILSQSYSPNFNLWDQPGYKDAFTQAADTAARAVSAKSGNPFGNPGAMGEIASSVLNNSYLPALTNYRGQLGQFGGLGLNTSGAASLGQAQSSGGTYDALGYGLGTIFNPQPSLSDILKTVGGGNYRWTL